MANERKNEKKLEILAVLLVLQHRSHKEKKLSALAP
jgi:hypothetical protein